MESHMLRAASGVRMPAGVPHGYGALPLARRHIVRLRSSWRVTDLASHGFKGLKYVPKLGPLGIRSAVPRFYRLFDTALTWVARQLGSVGRRFIGCAPKCNSSCGRRTPVL